MPQIGRKWPKFRFFAFGHQKQECSWLRCINERCACAMRTYGRNIFHPNRKQHLHFWEKPNFFPQFFTLSRLCHLIVVLGGAADPSVGHISAISTARRFIFSPSSSVWHFSQPGIQGFVLIRHSFELFLGTKKWKFKMVRLGWNLQISRMTSRGLARVRWEKKFFFLVWPPSSKKNFFCFFFEMSNCFDGNRPARYDLLLVNDENIELALKLGALGADKPPANNTK